MPWALATGGTLGVSNDPRYNKSRCFETFPLPDQDTGLTPALRQHIATLAGQIDTHRKRVLSQLPPNLKFLPQKSDFPLSNSRNCGSAFCLHFDLIDQVQGAFLLRVGHRGDLESRCVVGAVGRATGVAHDG